MMAENVIKRLKENGADVEAIIRMLNKALADEY